MRISKRVVAGIVLGIAVSAAVYAQQKGGSAKALTQEDYVEIQRLYARYNWALDSHADKGMALANLFTPDAEWISGTTKYVGHERLARFGAGTASVGSQATGSQAAGSPHHYAMNILISPTPEGARGSAYLLYVTPSAADKPATVVTGTYDDMFVKTAQGWRFKRREFGNAAMMPEGVRSLTSN